MCFFGEGGGGSKMTERLEPPSSPDDRSTAVLPFGQDSSARKLGLPIFRDVH